MVEKVENVSKIGKVKPVEPEKRLPTQEFLSKIENEGRNTFGFAVNSAPIWLCKEVHKEAEKFYAGNYWPVIIEWYRKSKEFENMVRGGLPAPGELEKPEIKVEEKEVKTIPLFGGHKAVVR